MRLSEGLGLWAGRGCSENEEAHSDDLSAERHGSCVPELVET